MNAIRTTYEDLPETVTLNIPKDLVHKRAEIIILTDDATLTTPKPLRDFFGSIPDFTERAKQGEFEKRSEL
jgi:hypothetical protein